MDNTYYIKRFSILIENINSNQLGIFFSLFLHLMILLVAMGLPDFFKPKQISLPNIIPIEIVNVSETTSITKKQTKNVEAVEKKIVQQKKFNASENLEIKKAIVQETPKIENKEAPKINLKKETKIEEKIINKNLIKEELKSIDNVEKTETLNIKKIKPKLKPKPKKNLDKISSDVAVSAKPQPKPEPDFSFASMLKDLRNEKSTNSENMDIKEKKQEINTSESDESNNQDMILSISEIDLLRQQLSSCWNAPAGAVIEKGMKVTISAKVQKNRRVIENSVRIIDTNIAINNGFYGPITESAMRTLLNPECTPLKLPENKYNLWKNLTITFDYSIMKGYSG